MSDPNPRTFETDTLGESPSLLDLPLEQRVAALLKDAQLVEEQEGRDANETALAWSRYAISRGMCDDEVALLGLLRETERRMCCLVTNNCPALGLNLAMQGALLKLHGRSAAAIAPLYEAYDILLEALLEHNSGHPADFVRVSTWLSLCLEEQGYLIEADDVLDPANEMLDFIRPLCSDSAQFCAEFVEFRAGFLDRWYQSSDLPEHEGGRTLVRRPCMLRWSRDYTPLAKPVEHQAAGLLPLNADGQTLH